MGRYREGDCVFTTAAYLCLMALAGLGCLIAGIVFFADYYDPDEKSSQINTFNSMVTKWNAQSSVDGLPMRLRFTQALSGNNITINSPYGSVTVAPYVGKSYGEPTAPQGSGISTYTVAGSQSVFLGNGALLGPQLIPWSGGRQSFVITATLGTGQTLFSTPVDFTFSRTYTRSKSGCKYGSRVGSSDCVIQFFPGPQGLCLVADTSKFPWIITGGCSISPQSAEDAMIWGVTDVAWQRTNHIGFAYTGFAAPYSWPYAYPVVIRSSMDPWTYAATSTYGSMQFGLVSSRYYQKATVLTAVGGGLLAPFILVLLGALILTSIECVKTLNEGEEYGCMHCGRGVKGRTSAAFHATADATYRLAQGTLRAFGRGKKGIDYKSDTDPSSFKGSNPMSPSQRAKAAKGPDFEVDEVEDGEGNWQDGRKGGKKVKKTYRNNDDNDLDDDGYPDDEEAARGYRTRKHNSNLATASRASRGVSPRAVSKGRFGRYGDEEEGEHDEDYDEEYDEEMDRRARKNWGKASAVMAVGSRNPLGPSSSSMRQSSQYSDGGFRDAGKSLRKGSTMSTANGGSTRKIRIPRPTNIPIQNPLGSANSGIAMTAMASPSQPSRNSSVGPVLSAATSGTATTHAVSVSPAGVPIGSSAAMADALNRMHRASTVMQANANIAAATAAAEASASGGDGSGSSKSRRASQAPPSRRASQAPGSFFTSSSAVVISPDGGGGERAASASRTPSGKPPPPPRRGSSMTRSNQPKPRLSLAPSLTAATTPGSGGK